MLLGRSANTVRYHQREGNLPKTLTVGAVLNQLDKELERAQARRDLGYYKAERLFSEEAGVQRS